MYRISVLAIWPNLFLFMLCRHRVKRKDSIYNQFVVGTPGMNFNQRDHKQYLPFLPGVFFPALAYPSHAHPKKIDDDSPRDRIFPWRYLPLKALRGPKRTG